MDGQGSMYFPFDLSSRISQIPTKDSPFRQTLCHTTSPLLRTKEPSILPRSSCILCSWTSLKLSWLPLPSNLSVKLVLMREGSWLCPVHAPWFRVEGRLWGTASVWKEDLWWELENPGGKVKGEIHWSLPTHGSWICRFNKLQVGNSLENETGGTQTVSSYFPNNTNYY